MEQASNSDDGIGDAIINVLGVPYQITVIPLFLPTPVAWIFGGFPLDNNFTDTVKQSIVSDVSIVEYRNASSTTAEASASAAEVEVIASTLRPADQERLTQQLQLTGMTHTDTQRIVREEGEYGTLMRSLYGGPGAPLQIVAVIQKSYNENIENLEAFQRVLLQFYLAVLALSLIAVIFLARSVTRPILDLAIRVKHIEEGDYGQAVKVRGKDEISQLAGSVNNMALGLAEKEKVRDLLGKGVSHEIAEELRSKKIKLGREEENRDRGVRGYQRLHGALRDLGTRGGAHGVEPLPQRDHQGD